MVDSFATLPVYLLQKPRFRTQTRSITLASMVSDNQASTANSKSETSKSTSPTLTVYVLSYDAKDWSKGVTLLNGSEPRIYYGILGAYGSISGAQDVGMEWVHKQLRDRLDKDRPFLATKEDKDEAFEDWPKYESEQRGLWSYTISKGDETLVVRAHNITVYDTWHF